MDYGNNKALSMYRRLGSATLSQLAFPGGESNSNVPSGKSQLDNTVVIIIVIMKYLQSTNLWYIYIPESGVLYRKIKTEQKAFRLGQYKSKQQQQQQQLNNNGNHKLI